ncbi:MAG: ATP-dependent DNA helicase [Verrucomicrobiota bacterium]|nr:ATP-dependent DNA helicase [Verrucomicrobiota bacterium]
MHRKSPKANPPIAFDISVRELVEFSMRRGDLGSGPRFLSPARALEGTRGHQKLQASRPAHYEAEIPLKWSLQKDRFTLNLRGRIDGAIETPEGWMLEEIKTVTGHWQQKASALHWAQLKIYGGMWHTTRPPGPLKLRLTYYHLEEENEHCFEETQGQEEINQFFNQVVESYVDWLDHHVTRCDKRNISLMPLAFPFTKTRTGQQTMLDTVAQLHDQGGVMMVEAPTGIGKTMATLFPSIRALLEKKVRQIVVVTARRPGQQVFQEALNLLERKGARLKSIVLSSRETLCVNGEIACDSATCPKRVGFYDRLHEARKAAVTAETCLLDSPALRAIGDTHQVCPHALSMELVPWMDVMVGDYNYAFDPGTQLGTLFGDDATRKHPIILLVDESHNLADRGREMHSQRMDTSTWAPVEVWLRKEDPRLAQGLRNFRKKLRTVFKHKSTTDPHPSSDTTLEQTELFSFEPTHVDPKPLQQVKIDRWISADLACTRTFPDSWEKPLKHLLKMLETLLEKGLEGKRQQEGLQLYFSLHQLYRVAHDSSEKHQIIIRRQGGEIVLHRFCLDPSEALASTWKRAWSTLFFSATLSPHDYYRRILGIPDQAEVLQLPTPFSRTQWEVLLHCGIATTYRQRPFTYEAVAEVIHALQSSRQGNYLVFFPSYSYLENVAGLFRNHLISTGADPDILMQQSRDMNETSRHAFLKAFGTVNGNHRVGFAVMGGIFGEGIDLVGERLIGVAVVGVGLPQVCLERDLIRDHFDTDPGRGFDFAYRYPGMNRVMQAMGRLIRSEQDQGMAVLIDSRLRQPAYASLLPSHWPLHILRSTRDVTKLAKAFWQKRQGTSAGES